MITVPDHNIPPGGALGISGTAQVNRILTADATGITDGNGVGSASYSYQWLRVDGVTDIYIPGATQSTYRLTTNEEGKRIKVRARFTDDGRNVEELTSEATDIVLPAHPVAEIAGAAVTSRPAFLSDTYGGGEVIEVTVTFDHPVEVTGTPYLQVHVGNGSGSGTETRFEYGRGSGTTEIVFDWPVPFGALDGDGIELLANRLLVRDNLGAGDVIGTITTEGTDANLDHAALGNLTGHKVSGVPRAVAGLNATGGPGVAMLGWSVPGVEDGYNGITNYQYRIVANDGTGSWQDVPGSDRDTVSHVVSDLFGGTPLTFEVRAENDRGGGPASTTGPVIPSASVDTTLTALSLTDADGADVDLEPSFASNQASYEAIVGNTVSMVTVAATPNHPGASVAYAPAIDAALDKAGHQVSLDEGGNTITVTSTAEDGTTTETYTLVVGRRVAGVTGICDRTLQVQVAILSELSGVNHCVEVTAGHLASINGSLTLSGAGLSSLMTGDFAGLSSLAALILDDNDLSELPNQVLAGLTSLTKLHLHDNALSELPADVFNGLSSLEELRLNANALATLPSNVFAGLTSLTKLHLHDNALSELPADVFNGLSSLEELRLNANALATLPRDVFAGLTSLEELRLNANALATLPSDVFAGLTSLKKLNLGANGLSTLPDGVFSGQASLTSLDLGGNQVDPLPVIVGVEMTGHGQIKAVVPAGAPFALTLPLVVVNGAVDVGDGSLRVPAGALESAPVTVSRAQGTLGAVTVDFDPVPNLPSDHTGYALTKSTDLPLEAVTSIDATLSSLSVTDQDDVEITLTPHFAFNATNYLATVLNEVSTVTVTPVVNDSGASVAYVPATDADPNTNGHQVSLEIDVNTITVTVTAADEVNTETYTLEVTRQALPTVTISAPVTSATYEIDGVAFEVTRSGSTASPLDVAVTLAPRFIVTSQRLQYVTIPVDAASAKLSVPTDAFRSGVPTSGPLRATVASADAYVLGTQSSATITMVVANPAITVRLGEAHYSFDESVGGGEFTVLAETVSGVPKPTDLSMEVKLDTRAVSASQGDDFTSISTIVAFTAADFVDVDGRFVATHTFSLSVLADEIEDPDEQLWLALVPSSNRLPDRVEVTLAGGEACLISAYLFYPDGEGACRSQVTITEGEGPNTPATGQPVDPLTTSERDSRCRSPARPRWARRWPLVRATSPTSTVCRPPSRTITASSGCGWMPTASATRRTSRPPRTRPTTRSRTTSARDSRCR